MDNLQHQRLELKYIIHEKVALGVRDFVSSHLSIDEFGAEQSDLSYPVHSLYLDSDHLTLYWHTINGNKNRYKLRLRYYDDRPLSPVFFEIKQRMNDAILKQRGAVKRTAVDALLAGQLPEVGELYSKEPGQFLTLERFCQLMLHHEAKPKAHVAYRREAWVSTHNNSVRVTMDRQIQLDPEPTASLHTKTNHPFAVFGRNVVLELKFTGRFPDWFRDLVRRFDLWQGSAAKYVDGVTLLLESGHNLRTAAMPVTMEAEERLHARREFLDKNQEKAELAIV